MSTRANIAAPLSERSASYRNTSTTPAHADATCIGWVN
jgi:hypothetical protein